jgi:hypothetical protein
MRQERPARRVTVTDLMHDDTNGCHSLSVNWLQQLGTAFFFFFFFLTQDA